MPLVIWPTRASKEQEMQGKVHTVEANVWIDDVLAFAVGQEIPWDEAVKAGLVKATKPKPEPENKVVEAPKPRTTRKTTKN
jgi:hypothetical protein